MNHGRPIFAQILAHLPERQFRRLVNSYGGNKRVRTFSCWDQLACMMFAQLTYRESLRDVEACLNGLGTKLYHMGIKGHVSRTNLADANEKRDWRIYQQLATLLIKIARRLYAGDAFGVDLKNTAYAFDSTTIDLCLSLFPWARFMDGNGGKTKGAVKLHTLLDLRGNIPSFIHISDGKMSDVCSMDHLLIEAAAFYIMDRGYHDFERLYRFTLAHAFFVTRPRSNTKYRRLYSHPCDESLGILCDQTILLSGVVTGKVYPDKLRRLRYKDPQTQKQLVFITNNFDLPAATIAQLYRARWQVELFFKWIKQHLRIKCFYGRTDNAVRTQIWIAIATYVLVAIIKKRLNITQSLYTILQVISISAFEKTPILSAFQLHSDCEDQIAAGNQLNIFAS